MPLRRLSRREMRLLQGFLGVLLAATIAVVLIAAMRSEPAVPARCLQVIAPQHRGRRQRPRLRFADVSALLPPAGEPKSTRRRTSSRRAAAPAGSASVECGLELLDRLDRRRVDAAQHGEVERDEVAEQHERDEPLDARLAAALDAERAGRVAAPIRPRVSSIRWRMRGCRSESSRKTALKRPSSAAPVPADDLVVVELGQLVGEGRAPSRSR